MELIETRDFTHIKRYQAQTLFCGCPIKFKMYRHETDLAIYYVYEYNTCGSTETKIQLYLDSLRISPNA